MNHSLSFLFRNSLEISQKNWGLKTSLNYGRLGARFFSPLRNMQSSRFSIVKFFKKRNAIVWEENNKELKNPHVHIFLALKVHMYGLVWHRHTVQICIHKKGSYTILFLILSLIAEHLECRHACWYIYTWNRIVYNSFLCTAGAFLYILNPSRKFFLSFTKCSWTLHRRRCIPSCPLLCHI